MIGIETPNNNGAASLFTISIDLPSLEKMVSDNYNLSIFINQINMISYVSMVKTRNFHSSLHQMNTS